MLSVISFREETLDLSGHRPPEGAPHPDSLLAPGLPRARLASHGVVHGLWDLDLHLLVSLVWPQPLTLSIAEISYFSKNLNCVTLNF